MSSHGGKGKGKGEGKGRGRGNHSAFGKYVRYVQPSMLISEKTNSGVDIRFDDVKPPPWDLQWIQDAIA